MKSRFIISCLTLLTLSWILTTPLAEDSQDSSNHWAYQALESPSIPSVPPAFQTWVRTPIDAFILKSMLNQGLSPSPEANRATLIRRLSIDLTGLLPTPETVEAFVNDPHPRAYEQWVDRLLSSPRYGERWARHWLDVAGYADTHGYDKDKPRPHAWPYRDYVIRSFNQDKPYNQFVREQVAGDVLFPDQPDAIAALGFLAAGPWDFIGHVEVPESKRDGRIARHLDRDNIVANVLNTFASTTVQCARCHDHKFDPIDQEHYYGLQAVFAGIDRADRPMNMPYERYLLRNDLLDEKQKLIDQKNQPPDPALPADGKDPLETRLKAIESQLQSLPEPQMVYAGVVHRGSGNFKGRYDLGPREVHVLARGDVDQPRQSAIPGAFAIGLFDRGKFEIPDDTDEGLRRAALAEWLIDSDNPLPWRSIVNRIWQHHFTVGLVDTPNDFGKMGATPTHPELLDWLACVFRDQGQSMKAMHRLIVNSSVYRQRSQDRPAAVQVDSSNQWYWRMNRRRMDAETVRDAILQLSGQLRMEMGGPGFELFKIEKPEHSPHYEYPLHDPREPATHRRSIYRFVVRSQPDPLMTDLDCADASQSVPVRNETLTAIQSLALMNHSFVTAMCEIMASHLRSQFKDETQQVRHLFSAALSRSPTEEEQSEWLELLREHGLENVCRIIVNLNEFHFVN